MSLTHRNIFDSKITRQTDVIQEADMSILSWNSKSSEPICAASPESPVIHLNKNTSAPRQDIDRLFFLGQVNQPGVVLIGRELKSGVEHQPLIRAEHNVLV